MPVDVKMPQLGESVTEGTIGRWLKQPGEAVAKYEPLLEVTTDKVDSEVPSTVDGTVLELLVPEGETVPVGALLARIATADDGPRLAAPGGAAGSTKNQPPHQPDGANSFVSPVVARLAAEHNLDLSRLRGTGANGRITKRDVEQYLAMQTDGPSMTSQQAPPSHLRPSTVLTTAETRPLQETMLSTPISPGGAPLPTEPLAPPSAVEPESAPSLGPGDELVPHSPMRRAIAEHMARSKRTAPHVTTVMEVDLSRITRHRDSVKADYERQGVRLTFTAYFALAAVAALRAVPVLNGSYRDEGVIMNSRINIGIAVAIPDGLIVPVIRDADGLSLLGVARAVNDLAERARARRLKPDETRDGTFTITNHGVSGSLFAMPIINQPQAAILGIGAIEKRAVVVSEGGYDAIAIRPRAYLSLTFDHRITDGATADHFLSRFKATMEDWGE
jgi:pyruvate/2-oxoglutarate dehydrogenase complex dihydrolipoamide acyltransferase (E2) component